MDNTAAIALLVGTLMPVIITILKQAGLNRWWNLAIAIVSCGMAGFFTVWARGELDGGNVLVATVLVFTAAQAVYASFWKDSGIETSLNNLTSIIKK